MEEKQDPDEESQENGPSPEMYAPADNRARKPEQFSRTPSAGPISDKNEQGFIMFKVSKLVTIPTVEKITTTLSIINGTASLDFWIILDLYEAYMKGGFLIMYTIQHYVNEVLKTKFKEHPNWECAGLREDIDQETAQFVIPESVCSSDTLNWRKFKKRIFCRMKIRLCRPPEYVPEPEGYHSCISEITDFDYVLRMSIDIPPIHPSNYWRSYHDIFREYDCAHSKKYDSDCSLSECVFSSYDGSVSHWLKISRCQVVEIASPEIGPFFCCELKCAMAFTCSEFDRWMVPLDIPKPLDYSDVATIQSSKKQRQEYKETRDAHTTIFNQHVGRPAVRPHDHHALSELDTHAKNAYCCYHSKKQLPHEAFRPYIRNPVYMPSCVKIACVPHGETTSLTPDNIQQYMRYMYIVPLATATFPIGSKRQRGRQFKQNTDTKRNKTE